MKILIAEDDLISRMLIKAFMSTYGRCDVVVDGVEAVELFLLAHKEGEPYKLICLDIMMPRMDGVAALKTIRGIEKQKGVQENEWAKIIMTTALNDKETVSATYELGCDAYAWKPLNLEKLKEVIEKLGFIKEDI
ncbi:MAG TPA: response regulator [Clostridiales bacterium]|nr:MAG: histidine kinase [Clostridiales bacterium GWD2_32_59]HAN09620.1 response regulator [Clostridiales bacterium]